MVWGPFESTPNGNGVLTDHLALGPWRQERTLLMIWNMLSLWLSVSPDQMAALDISSS
jgi:hypothetical protein